jgi:hypothetical protein
MGETKKRRNAKVADSTSDAWALSAMAGIKAMNEPPRAHSMLRGDTVRWGLIWIIISAMLIFSAWDNIITRAGWDPDDQLRLVQLRDFLNGQSWFDTTQYRMNPPDGAPMHWSRLIELPLAFIILTTKPLFGQAVAEMIAGTSVPLFGFGLTAYILGRITTRLANTQAGTIAFALTLTSPALIPQFNPMRIDHHGWQIVLAVLGLWTMQWSDKKRAGIMLGGALAIWMHISLEGLPAAAAFFVLLGWRWVIEKVQGQRLLWTVASFASASLLLYFGTQTHGLWAPAYCDTVSPPYIVAIVSAAIIMLTTIVAKPAQRRWRIGVVILAGIAAAAAILVMAPQCSGGAFGNLDPLVREYWYAHINEGLPVWHQDLSDVLFILAGPACGLIALIALRSKVTDRETIDTLHTSGYFLTYAIIISLLVFRTVSVAAAFAIPVIAMWINMVFQRYRQSFVPLHRVSLVAAMLFLSVPGAFIVQIYTAFDTAFAQEPTAKEKRELAADQKCSSIPSIAALSHIPSARFLAPFDLGPAILMATPHKVLASSHHRNEKAMHDQIEIWRSDPEKSRLFINKHGIQYIAACPFGNEMAFFARKHPAGLWGLLAKGKPPLWLEPMPDMGKGIKVWRVHD